MVGGTRTAEIFVDTMELGDYPGNLAKTLLTRRTGARITVHLHIVPVNTFIRFSTGIKMTHTTSIRKKNILTGCHEGFKEENDLLKSNCEICSIEKKSTSHSRQTHQIPRLLSPHCRQISTRHHQVVQATQSRYMLPCLDLRVLENLFQRPFKHL